MKKTRCAKILVVALIVSATGGASSQEYERISGSYAIVSQNIVDPAPGEKKDRVALSFDSDTARRIFMSMPAASRRNACSADLVTKSSGGLVCSHDVKRGEYQCTVGILLETGDAVDVSVC